MFFKKILTVVAMTTLLTVCGCASSTQVESNRAADYTPNIKTLFILPNIRNTLVSAGGTETSQTLSILKAGFQGCGIGAYGYAVLPLAGKQFIDEVNPDVILEITWTKQTETTWTGPSQGSSHAVDYLVSLFDRHSKAVVWKASITLREHGKAPEALANAITRQMQKDGLISAACVTKAG